MTGQSRSGCTLAIVGLFLAVTMECWYVRALLPSCSKLALVSDAARLKHQKESSVEIAATINVYQKVG